MPRRTTSGSAALLPPPRSLTSQPRTSLQLEFGFGHIHFLKQLQGERRLGTCWRVMQLGGVPLLADAIAGDKQSVGFGLTLTGMLIQEENLLSHRFGKQLLKNDKFLPAVDRLLTPDPDDEMMQLLVSQVCNNFMKTATADAVCAVSSNCTGAPRPASAGLLARFVSHHHRCCYHYVCSISACLLRSWPATAPSWRSLPPPSARVQPAPRRKTGGCCFSFLRCFS